ncbi:MAG: DUF177 domain-containing protein [Acidimicrobiales bacterium]|jgi:uncharacterized protein|nr:DUF177 domain-containing protein [Acidimicrobiales bacterium]
MPARPLVVGIADLRRHPGSRRRFVEDVVLPGLGISTAEVPEGASIRVDVELETLSDGLVATGVVRVPWTGECRRCLNPVTGSAVARVKEVFEPRPVEGETYALGDDLVDLEPMVRDAVLLALPLAPLCGPDCLGPAPDDFPAVAQATADVGDGGAAEAPVDPRWAALDGLHFDSGAEDG